MGIRRTIGRRTHGLMRSTLKGEQMERVKQLIQESNADIGVGIAKGGAGLGATITAMSINDFAGLVVAILTGIYMMFQIEAAWHKRKEAKKRREISEIKND